MKKTFLSAVLALGAILCLTGCGNKPSTLVCSTTQSGVEATLTSNFIGKEIKGMGLTYTMDLSKYSDTQISAIEKQDFCKSVSSAMKIYGFTLVDCSQVIENKQLLVSSGIDLTKIDDSLKKGSVEATKTQLETQGFKCEIKK